jgi:hypothetical protein
MTLGLIYGRDREKLIDSRSYQGSLTPARRLCRRFEEEMGNSMYDDIIEMNDDAIEKCGEVI